MYEGINMVFIHSLCIFVDILTVCLRSFIFFNIKYEYNITLMRLGRSLDENLSLIIFALRSRFLCA